MAAVGSCTACNQKRDQAKSKALERYFRKFRRNSKTRNVNLYFFFVRTTPLVAPKMVNLAPKRNATYMSDTRVNPAHWPDGYAMLMSPNKGETAVHGCHCPGDMVVRMRKVPAIPRNLTAGLVVVLHCCQLVLFQFFKQGPAYRSLRFIICMTLRKEGCAFPNIG